MGYHVNFELKRKVGDKMKKLLLLLAIAGLVLGLGTTKAMAVTIGLPIKEVRTLIDVSSVDAAVKRGEARVEKGCAPATAGGKWAFEQAERVKKAEGVEIAGCKKTVVYEIDAVDAKQDIAGVEFPVWAFIPHGKKDFKNPHGPVPGPVVIADEGDLVRIILRNFSKNRHTIHIHGPTIISYAHDGTMNVAQIPLDVDKEFTYEFVAWPSGTHIYHCHVNANEHMDMGLYSAIVIHGRDDEKVSQDLLVLLDEWDSKFSLEEGFSPTTSQSKQSAEVGHPRGLSHYNLFTINGNAWTDEYPNVVLAKTGANEKIRVRFINFGNWPHNIHLHGHTLHWVAWDGRNVFPYNGKISNNDLRSDSASILPGERKDYIFIADQEGRWVWHCHLVPHATNDGVYHGGLLMAIVYVGKMSDGSIGPHGIDLDVYPLGRPVKIGAKPYDAL